MNENDIRAGKFFIPPDERLLKGEQEHYLLLAMVEDLLRRELALREGGDLVFPSQSTREHPDLPDPKGKRVVFDFEGPVLNIYATLAVRLAQSGTFRKNELWKNAITYRTGITLGSCGIYLRNIDEGCGELSLFFDSECSTQARELFEEFVQVHLQRRALPESVRCRSLCICQQCERTIPEEIVDYHRQNGSMMFPCPFCKQDIDFVSDPDLDAAPSPQVRAMEKHADQQRDLQAAWTILEGKRKTNDFDVFLCCRDEDLPAVRSIANQLLAQGILPWLAERQVQPGTSWISALEQQIRQVKAAAVFIGPKGVELWQEGEINALLRQFVRQKSPVIPVLLPGVKQEPELPIFLGNMRWVDFRKGDVGDDPLELLKWGITGRRERDFF